MSFFSISKYEDIEKLWINNQIETMNLEFKKEITNNQSEVAKDVSSFANSEGGVIVYGVSESQGRAISSSGIPISNNSERIQQIISSSTAPEVPVDIEKISIPLPAGASSTHEFVIVKIPKSPFMIHQVTTTSKFYVRNNTITQSHVYEPFEMKENEIAMRYENRFRTKQMQISFIQEKEVTIIKELGSSNWNAYLLFSFIPHVRIPNSIKVTREFYSKIFVNNGTSIYRTFPLDPKAAKNIPSVDGRMSDPSINSKTFFETDNDRSVYFCRHIGPGYGMNMFEPMFVLADLLHLVKRILVDTKSYGGLSFRLKVRGSIKTDEYVNFVSIPNGGRDVSDFEIYHEIPFPFDFEKEFRAIFEKYFEGLHIDDSLTLFNASLNTIMPSWSSYETTITGNPEPLI